MGKLDLISEKHNQMGYNPFGGTDKGSSHSYFETYENILSPYVNNENIFLEIGVQYGGSSLMWYEFMPKSKLIMFDIKNQINPKVFELMDQKRYSFDELDAYDPKNLLYIKEKYPHGFDIIIDDGPHTFESQSYVVETYMNLLNDGGIMIIEDIPVFLWAEKLLEISKKHKPTSSEIVDLRNVKNRWDDILLIIKK